MTLGDLGYGSARSADGRRLALARRHGRLLDLAALDPDLFVDGSLDGLLAAGRETWEQVNRAAVAALDADVESPVVDGAVLAFTVADYVDFFASEHHATNAGRILRPDGEALTPNWKHLPIGYHGRAGSLVVSGTEVRRPSGQRREADGTITFGPSRRLDFEAELAFIVGVGSEPGVPVPVADIGEHVFGVGLLNDWSARDIQAWESVPLGPMLGKSFATSLAAWITPLAVLEDAWCAGPVQDPAPLPYLADPPSLGLDLWLTVSINGTLVSTPPYASMYWTPAQLLAHLTSNGAHLRTGDVIASGTVSGPRPDQRGCLLELSWAGTESIALDDGTLRTFLEDGDEVVLTATAPSATGAPLTLGEARGRVIPAHRGHVDR